MFHSEVKGAQSCRNVTDQIAEVTAIGKHQGNSQGTDGLDESKNVIGLFVALIHNLDARCDGRRNARCGTSWSRDHPEGQSEEWILVGERFWGRMSKIWASV